MSKDLNKVQIIGRLGADPEMRYTGQGSAVTSFRVAVNGYSRGAEPPPVEWFRCVAWDKLGEICNEYLAKGTRVYVEGRLQTRKYTDRDGAERYATEVIASDMIILSAKGDRAPAYDEPGGDVEEEELFEEPAPAPPPAAPSPSRTPTRAATRTSAPNAPRSAPRNQPQPINGDEDIPF